MENKLPELSERHIKQIIRRKTCQQVVKSKKVYSRKEGKKVVYQLGLNTN
jgi:hypothetical protein